MASSSLLELALDRVASTIKGTTRALVCQELGRRECWLRGPVASLKQKIEENKFFHCCVLLQIILLIYNGWSLTKFVFLCIYRILWSSTRNPKLQQCGRQEQLSKEDRYTQSRKQPGMVNFLVDFYLVVGFVSFVAGSSFFLSLCLYKKH